jgi:DNA-directed RNA polymerase specialized sigma subunit
LGGTQTEETERLLDTVVWEGFFDSERRYAQKFSVRELLGCLTEKQRYVVAAEIFEDKDDVEIAGMMKISKSAVSRIRTRAIRYLQDILDVRQGKEVPLC